jgi:hypothetical protein
MWSHRLPRAALCLITAFTLATSIVYAEPAAQVFQVGVDGSHAIDATGHGSVLLHVHVTAADSTAFPVNTPVRALILRGDARLSAGLSSDLTTDEASNVALTVYPGTKAGPLVIHFTAGEAAADLTLALTADLRAPLVVGYATGGIGPVPGWTEAQDGAPNGTTSRRGAIALYGTGQIAKNTRGTFAYDSSNTLQQMVATDPFLDNPDDRPFPTYGDASIRYDDALSTNRIFADIQNGAASAMWGQFYAQAAPTTAVGGYNILVDGAKVVAGTNALGLGAFTAQNNTAFARTVISPTGLAIASQALHPDVVIGSDVLTLVHLDRRSGAIVSETPLGRGTDYIVDYPSGLLTFLNIILPYDEDFNPQVVVVQYEYGGPGATSTMLGGKGTAKIGRGTQADAWYLNDSIGTGNLTLLGESLAGTSPSTVWSLSHEHSAGFLPITTAQYGTAGDAYRGNFTTHAGPLSLAFGFAATDAAYDNPYGNYTAPGLVSFNGTAAFKLSRITALELSYIYAHNDLPASLISQAVDNSDSEAAVTLRVTPSKRLKYHVGIASDAATSNGVINPLVLGADPTQSAAAPGNAAALGSFLPAFTSVNYNAGSGSSIDLDAGFDWNFTDHASIGVSRNQPLGGSTDPYDPPATQAEFGIDVASHTKAFIRQLWQQSSSQSFAASQAGQTFSSTAMSQTSIGLEDQIGPATYQTGYAVEHTASGTDLYDAIGMRTKLLATARFNADGFFQLGDSLYSTYNTPAASPYFMTVGTSMDYHLTTFKATGQVQIRTGFDSGSSFQLGSTGPISPAVSLYGSYTGSFTQGIYDTEGRGGLAYRPSRNDRYVTLLSADIYRTNLTDYDAYITNVIQLQELYRSSTRTEWAASAAYKITGDSFFAPRTEIWGMRGDQRIGGRFDIGSEVHWSDIAPLSGTNATGFAAEAGYRLGSTLRLAAGYNFSGFADPDTAINPTHRGVYVTLSTYIDRIFGWGKDDQK